MENQEPTNQLTNTTGENTIQSSPPQFTASPNAGEVAPAPVKKRLPGWLKIVITGVVVALIITILLFINRSESDETSTAPDVSDNSVVTEIEKNMAEGDKYVDPAPFIARINDAANLGEIEKSISDFLFELTPEQDRELIDETAYILPSANHTDIIEYDLLEASDLRQMKYFGKIFLEEFSKYSGVFASQLGIQGVFFVKNIGGTAIGEAGGVVADAIYYGINATDDIYNRELIHHEFGHVIAGLFSDEAYALWQSYNPDDFAYLGYDSYDGSYTEHPTDGFVRNYAMLSIDEDIAELYCYMLTKAGYEKIQEWTKTDKILNNKMAYIEERIHQIQPKMNDEYFRKIVLQQE